MDPDFIAGYTRRDPGFGFPMGAGNTLGEHSWLTKYARRKPDGTRERFSEGLDRVISGMYSIQKDHAAKNRMPWNEAKAQASAQEAYHRAFLGKWSPPGRGLWMLGTEMVNGRGDSSALQNCGFISTEDIASAGDPSLPFSRTMDMLMLGVGIGFDTRGAGKITLHQPEGKFPHQIPDSREGWVESVASLLRAFLLPARRMPVFDYSRIRPAGEPIRGFGGTASGPAILQQLHEQLTRLLGNRQDQPLTSTDIADIMNLAGKCVVAGNVRRSAEIALGDPADENFLDLKNWKKNPERMGANGWGHLSNNSVIAYSGSDYSHLAERIALNGEPGLVWLDMMQEHGRLADPPDHREYRTKGTNPCQPEWAPLLTPGGITVMGEIKPGDTVWSQDGWVKVTRKIRTGVETVYRYRTTAGYVDATVNHRVMSGGIKTELGDAQSIDRLRGGLPGTSRDVKDILAGLMLGDGYLHETRGNAYHVLCIGENDQDYFSSEIAGLIKGRHGTDRAWTTEKVISGSCFRRLPERFMPPELLGNPSVLRGLYSANGSVVSGRVTFKTASPQMRDDVQLSLSALGIASYFTTNKPSRITWANGDYESRESYDVNIGRAQDAARFAKIIGFIQGYKMDKLRETIRKDTGCADQSFGITETEHLGRHDVWDITVDGESHTYWSGGMNVSNCAEQALEDNELCTLCESFPYRHTDLKDYLRTLKFAYLYAKSVTLLPVQWPESNEVMNRNRRIGTSMTGVVQFAEANGWAELRRWQDEGYREIRRWDRVYSEWLGVRESIRVTTVKPSGTVSLLWGATPGVHWPRERGFYVRTVRDMAGSPFASAMEEAGYPVEPSVMDPETTVVITLPVEGPDIRPEREVSLWEKTALAAQCQRWWSDNAVSCTITFSAEEAKDIPAVLRAFDGQLKSVSFLPMAEGTYPQAPYQRVSKERWDELRARVKPVDWDALYGNPSLPDAQGELYCSSDTCEVP
jgi:ribonucleotide reductase alpha subunit